MPEGSPASLTQKPSMGTSWDYKMEGESRDLWLPRWSVSLCPEPGLNREPDKVSSPGSQLLLHHTQCSSPDPLPFEHGSPSWASMDMKVQMNSS